MKKIFSIVAAAVIALSFASCNGNGGATSGGFKITVSNIEATTATIAVEPVDKEGYWNVTIYAAEDVAKYGVDSIAAYDVSEIAMYVAYGYGLDVLAQYGMVLKGDLAATEVSGLPAKTDLTVIAYEIKEDANGNVTLGRIDSKNFTTKDVAKKGEKSVTLTNGELDDSTADYGYWQLMIADADTTMFFSVSPIEATTLAGTWKAEDMDYDYTFVYELESTGYAKYAFTTFECTTTAENDLFHLTGKGLAANGIEYTVDFSAPIEAAAQAAPAKKAPNFRKATNGLAKRTFEVKRVVK